MKSHNYQPIASGARLQMNTINDELYRKPLSTSFLYSAHTHMYIKDGTLGSQSDT